MREQDRRDGGVNDTSASPHCTVRSVDMGSVRWTDGLWADRFEQTTAVTLPYLWEMLADPEQGGGVRGHTLAGRMGLQVAAGRCGDLGGDA